MRISIIVISLACGWFAQSTNAADGSDSNTDGMDQTHCPETTSVPFGDQCLTSNQAKAMAASEGHNLLALDDCRGTQSVCAGLLVQKRDGVRIYYALVPTACQNGQITNSTSKRTASDRCYGGYEAQLKIVVAANFAESPVGYGLSVGQDFFGPEALAWRSYGRAAYHTDTWGRGGASAGTESRNSFTIYDADGAILENLSYALIAQPSSGVDSGEADLRRACLTHLTQQHFGTSSFKNDYTQSCASSPDQVQYPYSPLTLLETVAYGFDRPCLRAFLMPWGVMESAKNQRINQCMNDPEAYLGKKYPKQGFGTAELEETWFDLFDVQIEDGQGCRNFSYNSEFTEVSQASDGSETGCVYSGSFQCGTLAGLDGECGCVVTNRTEITCWDGAPD